MKIDIKNCQRCGKDHTVHFSPLDNPADDYTYWGVCSNVMQPVLLKVENEYARKPYMECSVCEFIASGLIPLINGKCEPCFEKRR